MKYNLNKRNKKSNENLYIMNYAKSVQIRSFFWSVFSCIRTKYGDLRSKSPYSIQIQENADQKKLRIWALFMQQCILTIHGFTARLKKRLFESHYRLEVLISCIAYCNVCQKCINKEEEC